LVVEDALARDLRCIIRLSQMERSQIITIAVTAAVTAAITVTVTTLTGWLVSLIKLLPASEKTKAIARTIFRKPNRYVIGCLFLFCINVYDLLHHVRDGAPLTRIAVFWIALATVSMMLWGTLLAISIMSAIFAFLDRRRSPASE
jgi:hypothetical protein